MAKTKRNNPFVDMAVDTMKLGVVSGVGMGSMGVISKLGSKNSVNMSGVTSATGAALNLAAIGNLASVGMGVATMPQKMLKKNSKSKLKYMRWNNGLL